MPFCLFSNLISAENLFLPVWESTLIHFFTHLSNSLSYGTIKVYLAAVKNLHIEFHCLQDLPSTSLLFKTLRDIKSSFGISKRSDLPITIFHQIYLVLQPSRYMNMNSSMLWATFTIAFSRFLHSSEFTSGGTFDAQIHLTRLEVSFCPDQLQPDYFETVVKKSKTDPFWETAKLTIAKSNSPVCAVYYCIKRLLPDKYTSSCSVSVLVLRYIAGTLPALLLLIIFTGLANQ